MLLFCLVFVVVLSGCDSRATKNTVNQDVSTFDTIEKINRNIERSGRLVEGDIKHGRRSFNFHQNHIDESTFDNIEKINRNFKDEMAEGDIKHGRRSINLGRSKRNIEITKLWKTTNIPYYIPHDMPTSGINAIKAAIAKISDVSCITFSKHNVFSINNEPNHVIFAFKNGCWSEFVGFHGGKQLISVGKNCDHIDIVLHEILHTLGFWHTHTRTDRNEYVEIKSENILPDQLFNFNIHPETTNVGGYDMKSIMHYGPYAFSSNGKETIISKQPGATLTENRFLTQHDIYQLNTLYCSNLEVSSLSTTTTTIAPMMNTKASSTIIPTTKAPLTTSTTAATTFSGSACTDIWYGCPSYKNLCNVYIVYCCATCRR